MPEAHFDLLVGVGCVLSGAAGRDGVAVTDADDKAEEGGKHLFKINYSIQIKEVHYHTIAKQILTT